MSTADGLLAVHAHPDDETLATGALLATWAAAGRHVTVVTCTRGEAGEVIGPLQDRLEGDGPALAAHRETELRHALEALGVTDHVFLDQVPRPARSRFVDSGMAWLAPGRAGAAGRKAVGAFVDVPVEGAAERLAAVVRARRPQVVVGYEPGGGYGHPDHVHAHRVMQRAVELAATRDGTDPAWDVPVVLWSVLDEVALRAGRGRLVALLPDGAAPGGAHRLVPADPHGPLPSCAVAPSQVDVEVDVAAVLDRVAGALRAHATQVQGVRTAAGSEVPGTALVGWFALSDAVLQPLLATETYRVARRGSGGDRHPGTWPAGVRPRVA